jgi:general secretion pathway protein A
VKDPGETRPPLVEDPHFLASLSELDQGLDVPKLPPPVRASAEPPAAAAAPPPRVAPQDLAELFPSDWLVSERAPVAIAGIGVGAALPQSDALRPPALEDFAPSAPHTCETFYGLVEKPFDLSTDPKFFFHSHAHERVATALLTAIRQRDGICLLTGEPGIGKTTMCRAIARSVDRRIVPSLLVEALADAAALLETLLVDFGVASREQLARTPLAARGDAASTLASFFASLAPLQAAAVVILDDAHRQPPDVLEQLRALAADGPSAGRLQVVLVAQPSFSDVLRTPALRTVDAAIARRLELAPLAADEIAGYIRHRLAVAGTSPRVGFDEAALQRIFDLSRGVPGIVNLLCDRALTGGFRRSAPTIDTPLVDAAAVAIGVEPPPPGPRERWLRALFIASLLVALLVAGGSVAAWMFRDALGRAVADWERLPPPPPAPALRRLAPIRPLAPPPDNPQPPSGI